MPPAEKPDAEVERRHRQIAERREQAIERSRTAMWKLVEVDNRQRETTDELDEQADEALQARLEIRDALLDAAIAWLEEKWGYKRTCPYCEHDEWVVSSPLDEYLLEQGPMSAQFEVMCDNCGHTVFVDARKAGLLPERGQLEGSPLEEVP